MAFIIPVIKNVKELDSFFTSDMAISLILNVATTLSEYSLTSCLYTCKDYSVISPSEAKLYSGGVYVADFYPDLFSSWQETQGLNFIKGMYNRHML